MKIKRSFLTGVAALLLAVSAFGSNATREELAKQAAADNSAKSSAAIRELRASGSEGLDALHKQYAAEIKAFIETGAVTDQWKLIANALDSVSMQKDDYASGLYWHTDLEEAKRVATLENKPILSLRLLGNLNEEFSCANSRLFRSILYSNSEVARYLKENYILHWRSVRNAPKVTIDFGDGRKIERTVTGNSIHYILDKNGVIIDALPGLYGPQSFLSYLTRARDIDKTTASLPLIQRNTALMRFRMQSFNRIRTNRTSALSQAKVTLQEPKDSTEALDVMPRAMSKAMVVNEVAILRVSDNFLKFEPQIEVADWQKIAGIYSPSEKLDAASTTFIRRQISRGGTAETDFDGMFAKLGNFIAMDSTRNDFFFHTKLYEWLNAGRTGDVEQFNTRVYADLFKTPESDKWLGLYSNDLYTALDGNGVSK